MNDAAREEERYSSEFSQDFAQNAGDTTDNEEIIKNMKFDAAGLVPAVVQDEETKQVLMLAYMNGEALRRTLSTGTTWFFSRSRQQLWNKGETSGHFQYVSRVSYDCDSDAVLVVARQVGAACHTGNFTCFYRDFDLQEPDRK